MQSLLGLQLPETPKFVGESTSTPSINNGNRLKSLIEIRIKREF